LAFGHDAGMSWPQIISFAILAGALGLFAWGKFRHDIVAVIALLAVAAAGLISPQQALSGFGHPAVITVAAVLVISRGLRNSGVVDELSRLIAPYTENLFAQVTLLTGLVAVASAFMNNVGALAVLMPVAIASARQRARSPAVLLMPLAFGSILGGMMTMIGTPPNIIISTYREDVLGAPFAMFDFSAVGAPVALLGVLFVSLVGWRLIPRERRGKAEADELFHIEEYVTEVKLTETSHLIGERIANAEDLIGEDVVIAGFARGGGAISRPSSRTILQPEDELVLRADPSLLKPILDRHEMEVVTAKSGKLDLLKPESLELIEAVVTATSPLENRRAAYLRRRSGYTMRLLALARAGQTIRERIRETDFKAGDVLLLQGEEGSSETLGELGLLPLPERGLNIGHTRRLWIAILVFAAAIAASAIGLAPIAICFLAAIVGYIFLDILPLRELYRHIDWPIIVLLGAMIPVGLALENTGATGTIADALLMISAGAHPAVLIVALMVITMFVSDVVNNAATAVIMAPIAVASANGLNLSPDPFLMAVAVGASCAFLTPIGHQSNTLVMGPGGYEFGDYWRMGLPLEVLIVAIATPLILWAWPL
jgi:di/tricarboxylate transporter